MLTARTRPGCVKPNVSISDIAGRGTMWVSWIVVTIPSLPLMPYSNAEDRYWQGVSSKVRPAQIRAQKLKGFLTLSRIVFLIAVVSPVEGCWRRVEAVRYEVLPSRGRVRESQ